MSAGLRDVEVRRKTARNEQVRNQIKWSIKSSMKNQTKIAQKLLLLGRKPQKVLLPKNTRSTKTTTKHLHSGLLLLTNNTLDPHLKPKP